MKVLVLGSGIVGLTSAWYLAKAGFEVCVVDRQPSSGQETSFANAGQISYGYSSPWAAPGIPVKAIKWMASEHSPLIINPNLSPAMYQWMWQLFVNCDVTRYQTNKARMLTLANYSRQCLTELRAATNIQYQGRQQGTLQLFRQQQQIDALGDDMSVLRDSGTEFSLLTPQQCLEREPGLKSRRCDIAGGLLLPNDETGDCELFSQQLTALAKAAGVEFKFNTTINRLVYDNGVINGVVTDSGLLTANNYVVALGSYSEALLKPMGLTLPVYPVKGYSMTVPLDDEKQAPLSTVMDESFKVAVTRFDDRIRVAGTAQLCGFDLSVAPKRTATLTKVFNDLFPQAGNIEHASFWSGLRPMTPDGTPIIGKTTIDNLYTNTGHGTLGWTMACGSAKLLCDQMLQQQTEINEQDYQLTRYQ